MIYQPNPQNRLEPGEAVFLECFHRVLFMRTDDPRIEGVHLHTCYEIYVNGGGDVSFLHGQTVYRIRPGDVILSKPGEFHHCIYHTDCNHDHYCVWFSVPPGSAAARWLEGKDASGLIRLEGEALRELFRALDGLCGDYGNGELEGIASFYRLLALLSNGGLPSVENPAPPTQLDCILDYVNGHFSEISSVEEIASAAHISVPTLNRWFREQLQLSPYRYLTAKKLAAAQTMLRQGCSVTESCFGSGFSDCSRFIHLFKKTYGKTPLQYQKSLETSKL